MSYKEKYKQLQEFLRVIFDTVKGNRELRNYLEPILDPANPQTSSNLTAGQVSFVEDSHWISKVYPELTELEASAEQIEKTALSKEGFGVKTGVNLVSALAKTKETKETTVTEKIRERVKPQ